MCGAGEEVSSVTRGMNPGDLELELELKACAKVASQDASTVVSSGGDPACRERVVHTHVVCQDAHVRKFLEGTLPECMKDPVQLGILN